MKYPFRCSSIPQHYLNHPQFFRALQLLCQTKKLPDLAEINRANLTTQGCALDHWSAKRQTTLASLAVAGGGCCSWKWVKRNHSKVTGSRGRGEGQLSLCWRAATPTQRHHTTRVVGGGKVFELSQPVSFLNWPAAILYIYFFGIRNQFQNKSRETKPKKLKLKSKKKKNSSRT